MSAPDLWTLFSYYAALESACLSTGGAPLRPKLRELEATICATLARQGGSFRLDRHITLSLETVTEDGKVIAQYFTAFGDHDAFRAAFVERHSVAVNTTAAHHYSPRLWKRGVLTERPSETAKA
jgi:hypothetical protein